MRLGGVDHRRLAEHRTLRERAPCLGHDRTLQDALHEAEQVPELASLVGALGTVGAGAAAA